MADIIAWSPVDESNNQPPPDGWPEGMAPSAVNNSARAIMGAVRRFYDQLEAGTSGLPYLKLTGGVLSGPLSATEYQLNNTVFAYLSSDTAHVVTDAAGTPALLLYASGNYYRSNSHVFQNEAGTIGLALLDGAGTFTAVKLVSAGPIEALSGTVTAAGLTSNGNITAASGTISGNLVTGNSVSSNTTVNGTQYNLRGAPFALMDPSATQTVIYDPTGNANITLYASGTNYYDNNSHNIRSRFGSTTYAIFDPGGSYNQTGGWGVISDDALKTDVAPYTAGLAAVRQLNPVSFRYTTGAAFRAEGVMNYGLMASEVQPVIPEMVADAMLDVDGVPTTTQTLLPTHLIYVLLNSVKELAARVEALEGAAHAR